MSKNNIILAVVSVLVIALAVLPGITAGYSGFDPANLKKLVPQAQEADRFSKEYFALLQSGDLEVANSFLVSGNADARLARQIDQMVRLFPDEEPKSVKVIGAAARTSPSKSTVSISSEYEFSDRWLLTHIRLLKQNDAFRVQAVSVQPLPASLEELYRFGFSGKSLKNYGVFAAVVVLLLFTLYAVALCIKTPIPKRKWLWIVFILAGVSKLSFNWTTGSFGFQPLSVWWPVAGFAQGPYQPFLVTMGFPLGAIVFLFKRRKWLA